MDDLAPRSDDSSIGIAANANCRHHGIPLTSRGTIFLVDDDEALRRATQRLLQACGFQVSSFPSAEAFLRAYEIRPAGCLLLDLRMNGLSGLELQQLLLQRGDAPPIVFFTGHADDAARCHAMEKGAIAFLEKPVGEERLIEALERALAQDSERDGDSAARKRLGASN